MGKLRFRTCHLCGEYMQSGEDGEGFKVHGETHHPNHELKITGSLDSRFSIKFVEKNYYCPLDNKHYSCLKWLSRAISSHGLTNEEYYITYGEQYLPDKWAENLSRPLFGHRHSCNTCLECNTRVKFNERSWNYPVFCGYKCSATWYSNNTNKVQQAQKTLKNRKHRDPDFGLNPTQVRYWIVAHGMTESQARQKVSERQSINKLEDYIQRTGGDIEQGSKLFRERQERWLCSLKKTNMKKGSSMASKKLFESVSNKVAGLIYGNQEAVIQITNTTVKVDCLFPNKNRIIEFYGDYWHGNPQKFGPDDTVAIRRTAQDVWIKDQSRIKQLEHAGFRVLVIWENEFKTDPQGVITKCVDFLNS